MSSSTKARATIALSREILEIVDGESLARGETRSALVEEALRFWQGEKLKRELATGYRAMAGEDKETAEGHLPLSREILS